MADYCLHESILLLMKAFVFLRRSEKVKNIKVRHEVFDDKSKVVSIK